MLSPLICHIRKEKRLSEIKKKTKQPAMPCKSVGVYMFVEDSLFVNVQ